MSNYPDDMNWQAYDSTIGSADTTPVKTGFEPITLSECDSCGELLLVNNVGLCRHCEEANAAFADALIKARSAGASREQTYAAGNAARQAIYAKYALKDICDSFMRQQNELTAKAVGLI